MYDVIIVGAGAAGLMSAISAGKNGKRALLIEHTNQIGEKIRISGGGRCNFPISTQQVIISLVIVPISPSQHYLNIHNMSLST